MFGEDDRTSYPSQLLSPEQRVPADHPLRAIRWHAAGSLSGSEKLPSKGPAERVNAGRSEQSHGEFQRGNGGRIRLTPRPPIRTAAFSRRPRDKAKLAYLGKVLMENRHRLVVDACVVWATAIIGRSPRRL